MNIPSPRVLALALALVSPIAVASEPARLGKGVSEIPDPELNLMRGRYTVGGNAVAWFGVTMVSQWQTQAGQNLQGALTLGMDFSQGGSPKVSFTPSVNITDANAALPDTGGRSIDASGLQNVAGMTQSVQVAGDGNIASNVTRLTIRDGGQGPHGGGGVADNAVARNGGASASASFDGNAASVLLQVEGQGAVQQWMRSGSVGQSIQLTADRQQVSNRMQIDLVRSSLATSAPLTQNVSQAIGLGRGIGSGPGG